MSYFDKDRAADSPAPRMSSFPKPGISSVGEYQQAGRPWLKQFTATGTGATTIGGTVLLVAPATVADHKQEFPYVAKRMVINNTSNSGIRAIISFCGLDVADDDAAGDSAALTHGNFYILDGGQSLTLEAKCRRIYIAGNNAEAPVISLYAELTGIEHDYDLDVEGISGISDA